MSVSVLIPAFRPTYLRQAIASVLTQGIEDLELVISDDSGGDEVRPIVERFADPRIRYTTTGGRVGPGANCRGLWEAARHERLIFLLDDDMLLPHALVELTAQLDAHPQASFAFGPRYIVDDRGAVLKDAVSPISTPTLLNARSVVLSLMRRLSNPFGELSNVLINRAVGLTADDLLVYMGHELHVVSDVGLFLNASRRGPAIATPRPVGAFRKHGSQNSSPAFNPSFAIGICEWELFTRGEYATGRLAPEEARNAVQLLDGVYRSRAAALPELALMLEGLAELGERIGRGDRDVLGPTFDAAWERMVTSVHARAPVPWKKAGG